VADTGVNFGCLERISFGDFVTNAKNISNEISILFSLGISIPAILGIFFVYLIIL